MPASRREKNLVGLTVVATLLFAVAATSFVGYARAHLRKPPVVDSCFLFAKGTLADLPDASGTERHEFDDGQVAYLRLEEDRIVRCAFQFVSEPYAEQVARALADLDPAERARRVVALVERAPAGPRGDAEATISYDIAVGTLAGLPSSPVVEEASFVVEETQGCRFRTDRPCPSRPPIPWVVPALGLPGFVGLLPALALGLRAGVRRLKSAAAKPTPKPEAAQ